MPNARYKPSDIITALSILGKYPRHRLRDARDEIARALGRTITDSNLAHALSMRGLGNPGSYCSDVAPALRGPTPDDVGDSRSVPAGCDARYRDPDKNIHQAIKSAQPCADVSQVGRDVRTGQVDPRGKSVDLGKQPVSGADKFTEREPLGDPERLTALLKATKRPVSFARLCDVLDMSPSKVRHLVDDARAKGYTIGVAGDEIGWKEPEPEIDAVSEVLPATSGRTIVGVISDTHFGSRYCLRKQLRDFIHLAYDAGARIILHAGDIVDGVYDHGRWELSHHGLEDQIQDALDTLPQLDGLRYIAITGNHDETFWKLTGYDTGRAINEAARGQGRTDIECVGARGAMLRIAGAKVELWHPKKGGAYALSYHLQNKIRDTGLGHKPDILLAGHWHTSVYLEQRGVHAMACGTFQGGGSAFSKSLGGAPSIGGTLLSWETTEHGTLRRVAVERVAYYEQEAPREVA